MDEALIYGYTARQGLPAHLRDRQHHVIRLPIDASRRPGSFFAEVERLREICGPGWNVRALDLLNVMCTLRAADRYYHSAGLFRNTRHLKLAVTVVDRRRWRAIGEILQR